MKLNETEIKKHLLEILVAFDLICKDNDLMYFLVGGTLLGAIRHEGFIPWDDDIDVAMPRKDYNKFIEIFKNQKKSNFVLESRSTKENHIYPFIKLSDKRIIAMEKGLKCYRKDIIGEINYLYIDIFPLDGVPSNTFVRWLFFKRLKYYELAIYFSLRNRRHCYNDKNLLKRIFKNCAGDLLASFYNLISYKAILDKLERLVQKYSYSSSDFVANNVGRYGSKEVIYRAVFSDFVEGTFEGKKFPIPIGFDSYLRRIYGDYMKLPAENDRRYHFDDGLYYNDNLI